MSSRDVASKRFTGRGQNESAILFVFEQTLGVEPLDHIGNTRLGNFETGGDIDHAGVSLRIDQIENALEIIFDRGRIARGMATLAGTMSPKVEATQK